MAQTIQDVFKQFCKERHAEDKGKNHDLLQEVYASTEFFDMEFLQHHESEVSSITLEMERVDNGIECTVKTTEGVSLPFQNNFIKCTDDIYIFIREFTPDIITGSVYALPNGVNSPFTIKTHPDKIEIVLTYGTLDEMRMANSKLFEVADKIATSLFKGIIIVVKDLNALSHKAVAVDKPANNFYEYYRRKRKPTIKIPRRPIYYVLGEKNEDVSVKYRYIQPKGTLEYSYAFKVRGHWRRVGDKTLGKDRNGVYGIKGYTWVIEHIRGEGELSKRLHVVK